MSWTKLEAWKRDLEKADVQVLDVHGCHPNGLKLNLWEEDAGDRAMALKRFIHRLRVTHALGGDSMVYHVPCHVEPTPTVLTHFMEGLKRAEEVARELGVSVALENHYLPENDKRTLSQAFERFDPEYIGFTFDPGHALISGNMEWIMDNCGSRLRILHLNDNDGESDKHWCPFDKEGKADWTRIQHFLYDSPYRKPIQLEVRWIRERYESHAEFLDQAHEAAVRIAKNGA
jgi:sugar phosphate isomerase/epimerase